MSKEEICENALKIIEKNIKDDIIALIFWYRFKQGGRG